ncbi:hypothetical protein HKX48_008700, partial [Thoreauomyces humboldtii]
LYSPRDLNDKFVDRFIKSRSKQPQIDVCEVERMDPLKEYKNTHFLSQFLTQMGYIKSKTDTGLSRYHQRRMTKAVKRAKAMGLMPFTYNLTSPKRY